MNTSRLICRGILTIALLFAGANSARVACYFFQWSLERAGIGKFSIDNIPGDLCTHAIYSFAAINTNTWQLKMKEPELDVSGYAKFAALKQRYPGLKTQLAVGGGNERGFSSLVADRSRRNTFIQSIKDYMERYNFDGVDLDWEYPGSPETGGNANDKANFAVFVQELKTAFVNAGRGWEITMAVPLVERDVTNGYDVPTLCRLVDAVNVMAYDMRGKWTGYADVQSPMYRRSLDEGSLVKLNVQDGLQLWEDRGCPRNKLILGVATYGHTYTLAGSNNKPGAAILDEGNPGPNTNSKGILAYYEICQNGWTRQWDKGAKCPYAYKRNQWVGYDDPRSVQIKMDFVKQKGYGGAMTWTVDFDDFRGVCGTRYPLISVMSRNMKNFG